MPPFAECFKHEVTRLSRKTLKKDVAALLAAQRDLRRTLSALRQVVRGVENRLARLEQDGTPVAAAAAQADTGTKIRPTAKMVRGLRTRWGLTQEKMAKVLGVSPNTIYGWEAKQGRLGLRKRVMARLLEVRGLGKRKIAKILAESK
jgi:DNA-binding transcriptional regulator YiaG